MYGQIYVYEATADTATESLKNHEFSNTLLGRFKNFGSILDYDIVVSKKVYNNERAALDDLVYGKDYIKAGAYGLNTRLHIYSEEHRTKLDTLKKTIRSTWDNGEKCLATNDEREGIYFNYRIRK